MQVALEFDDRLNVGAIRAEACERVVGGLEKFGGLLAEDRGDIGVEFAAVAIVIAMVIAIVIAMVRLTSARARGGSSTIGARMIADASISERTRSKNHIERRVELANAVH